MDSSPGVSIPLQKESSPSYMENVLRAFDTSSPPVPVGQGKDPMTRPGFEEQRQFVLQHSIQGPPPHQRSAWGSAKSTVFNGLMEQLTRQYGQLQGQRNESTIHSSYWSITDMDALRSMSTEEFKRCLETRQTPLKTHDWTPFCAHGHTFHLTSTPWPSLSGMKWIIERVANEGPIEGTYYGIHDGILRSNYMNIIQSPLHVQNSFLASLRHTGTSAPKGDYGTEPVYIKNSEKGISVTLLPLFSEKPPL